MEFLKKLFLKSQADTGPLGASSRAQPDSFLNMTGLSHFWGKVKEYFSIEDSGWIYVAEDDLDPEFKFYSGGEVKYRKVNGVVEIAGVVQPKVSIDPGTTYYRIFSLPAGYRPSGTDRRAVMHGSGVNKWLLVIGTNGDVTFSRYSNGSSAVVAPTSAWLPFSHTFIAG